MTLASFPSGTLVRAGNAIDFNGSACGTATVMNTDQITVQGSGSSDWAVIDLSGGPFSNPNLPGDIPMSIDLGASDEDQLTIRGSANADAVRLGTAGVNLDADSTTGVDVTVTNVERFAVVAGGGDDVVSAAGGDGTGAAMSGPVSIDGGPASDTLTGGAGGDDLVGGPGDDSLVGGGGQDTADYWQDPGPVTANLMTGTATDGTGGHDTLTGIENLSGGGGGSLIGDDNANVLTAGNAARTLGEGGDDIIQGAGGAIDGGAGTDTYYCVGDAAVSVDLATGLTAGCGPATLSGIEDVTLATVCDSDMGCSVEIIGDGGDNVLMSGRTLCNCLATISGGGGADTLSGSSLGGPGLGLARPGDVLDGGPGNDVILGRGGDDRLVGGPGADTIFAGLGADHVWGVDGRDTLVGGPGADVIRGGRGADDLFGRRGPDHLYGGFGTDRLNGGRGIDTCHGGPGTDTLTSCE